MLNVATRLLVRMLFRRRGKMLASIEPRQFAFPAIYKSDFIVSTRLGEDGVRGIRRFRQRNSASPSCDLRTQWPVFCYPIQGGRTRSPQSLCARSLFQ